MLGGVDVKDTVWRIMKQAIKNDLAKTVNWRGVNGKTSFQSLELKSVVIGKCFCRKSFWNSTSILVLGSVASLFIMISAF